MSCIVHVALPNTHESRALCNQALEKRLAAAAHFYENTNTAYWWNGEIRDTQELIVAFITTEEKYYSLSEFILSEHPYEVPCIMKVDINGGHLPFLNWINESTSEDQ